MCMSIGYLEPLVYYYFYFWCHICACKFMQTYFSFNLLRWRQPFPVTGLPVLNSVTDSSRHTLLLPELHSQWSHQVYIIHRSITGFLVVQNPYVRMRMSIGYLEPLVIIIFIFFIFCVTFVHANLCQPANFCNYSKKELQRKTIFLKFLAGVELTTSESAVQCLIHWTTAKINI